jgi:predicted lipid-binding transport protein (Tim44 family)
MRRLLPLLPLVALAGCSGTPFGDQLSRSFSTPPAASPAVRPAAPAPAAAAKPKAAAAVKPAAPSPARPQRAVPAATPAPYRVTIKLPAADPAAPAERVTEALRAAGVSFEVETIERVKPGGDGYGAPQRSAAPPPR